MKCELYVYIFSFLVEPLIGGCRGTYYGCCADGKTQAMGPKRGCSPKGR